jgi:hypothetical protein
MISFKMKILNFNVNGTYSVEYIPDNEKCTPIKLEIQLDSITLGDENLVIERLKASSPQDYWQNEINNSVVNIEKLKNLVNTTYHVKHSVGTTTVNPVTGFTTPPTNSVLPAEHVNLSRTPAPRHGNSTPEQVASRDDQSVIRLKILIQQVLQEMAEGTV